jgi:hypothetical protein
MRRHGTHNLFRTLELFSQLQFSCRAIIDHHVKLLCLSTKSTCVLYLPPPCKMEDASLVVREEGCRGWSDKAGSGLMSMVARSVPIQTSRTSLWRTRQWFQTRCWRADVHHFMASTSMKVVLRRSAVKRHDRGCGRGWCAQIKGYDYICGKEWSSI